MKKTEADILLTDDDPSVRRVFAAEIRRLGFCVRVADDIKPARSAMAEFNPDLVILDIRLPGGSGADLLTEFLSDYPGVPIIMMTAHAEVELAVDCMKRGAYDFLVKPCTLAQLETAIRRGLSHRALVEQKKSLSQGHTTVRSPGKLLGDSESMAQLREMIGRVAATEETVLITGESGTGKELIAYSIWKQSPRADGPFIAVNCSAVAETLLESELFGHEKGAFSGADNRRIGMLELASGGTLFLDEVGDMPLSMQAKLLRALESGEIRRVGGEKVLHIDARVVAATNRNLDKDVEDGRFREDLLHRINTLTLHAPPLRERPDDLEILCGKILKEFSKSPGGREMRISKEALETLKEYTWPGNVRELENTLKRAAILSPGRQIQLGDFPPSRRENGHNEGYAIGTKLPLAEIERRHIIAVLDSAQGNKAKAARILGITAKTLYNKLKSYKLQDEDA